MYYQNLISLIFFISIFISIQSNAQTSMLANDISMSENLQNDNWEGVPTYFKALEINKIERIDNKHSKIFYTKNNTQYEAIVKSKLSNPSLIASCEEISIDKLPKAIKNIFNTSRYGIAEIQKVFITSTPNSSDFYRIDINYKAQNISLFYNKIGRYHKPPY